MQFSQPEKSHLSSAWVRRLAFQQLPTVASHQSIVNTLVEGRSNSLPPFSTAMRRSIQELKNQQQQQLQLLDDSSGGSLRQLQLRQSMQQQQTSSQFASQLQQQLTAGASDAFSFATRINNSLQHPIHPSLAGLSNRQPAPSLTQPIEDTEKLQAAPKRFKTPYICFSSQRHKEIKEELSAKGIKEKVGAYMSVGGFLIGSGHFTGSQVCTKPNFLTFCFSPHEPDYNHC